MARASNSFCAFCRSPRKVTRHRGVRVAHVMISGLTAFILTLIVFQELDPRGILFFILALAVAEIFLRIRWRIQIVCQHCGFDPVLYLKHPDQAVIKVKSFLAHRKESAEYLLAPALNLPTISMPPKDQEKATERRGNLLSQRI